MKGAIEKNGYLWIERAGKIKKQYCPHDVVGEDVIGCGDWCPMFGEPEQVYTMKNAQRGEVVGLQICRVRFSFHEFVDKRQGAK